MVWKKGYPKGIQRVSIPPRKRKRKRIQGMQGGKRLRTLGRTEARWMTFTSSVNPRESRTAMPRHCSTNGKATDGRIAERLSRIGRPRFVHGMRQDTFRAKRANFKCAATAASQEQPETPTYDRYRK